METSNSTGIQIGYFCIQNLCQTCGPRSLHKGSANIQDVMWLAVITAGDDLLGFCIQKLTVKNVWTSQGLRSHGSSNLAIKGKDYW